MSKTRKRTQLALLAIGIALAAAGCAGMELAPAADSAETATSSERVAGEVSVLSEAFTPLGRHDKRATISELQFSRANGTEVICFRLHTTEAHGAAGGIDCPEWAQPPLEPKTKEHPKS